MRELLAKIKKKNITIGVIGLGYVGLPICLKFLNKNFSVIGIDNNKIKINNLKKFKSNISTISNLDLKKAFKKSFLITNNYSYISKCEIIIICVPTPIKTNKSPDMSDINNVVKNISNYLKQNQAIILESTVYPGATEEYFLPIIVKKKLLIGKNFFLGFSPEREDPGNKNYSILKGNIPKIISGYTNNCLKIVDQIYSGITKTVAVSSIKTAEFTKLLENVYRSVNIGFVNEMKVVANNMGIDINESIDAAKTKPFGFKAFYPGPGPGGHCIPVDPYILAWKAKQHKVSAKFIELSGNVNKSMCSFIIKILLKALKIKINALKGKKILILGLSYKKNSSDLRDSPAFRLINLLKKRKSIITCVDPCLNVLDKKKLTKSDTFKLTKLSKIILKKNDATIIVTNHDLFNYKMIKKYSNVIIDTRNSFATKNKKIFTA